MRAKASWMTLGIVALAAGAWAQGFILPSPVNAGADSDLDDERFVSHAVDHNGVLHAVWSSRADYSGTSGGDADIWHSHNAGGLWSVPALVNSFGDSDSGEDSYPRLIVAPNGALHCVWQSYSDYAGTGTDSDIFHAEWSGTAWLPAVAVNSFAAADNGAAAKADRVPTITAKPDGQLIVAWESTYPDVPGVPGGKGSDRDILYSVRAGETWSEAAILNTNAVTDTGSDLGPAALATADDGTVYAAWSTNDDFRPTNPKGTDYDIVWSTWPPGFKWTELREATALARNDTGTDRNPSVAVYGSGFTREFHLVWESNEPLDGSGNDYDLLHTWFGLALPMLPMNVAWHVNTTATTDGPTDNDVMPSLAISRDGILNCAWESTVNLGATGGDRDIFCSYNATLGDSWSPTALLGQNGLSDGPGENDYRPDLLCLPDGTLSCAWHSSDDLVVGTTGSDYDILQTTGVSVRGSRTEPINTTARTDQSDSPHYTDASVSIAIGPDGTLQAVWASDYPEMADGTTGSDYDIFYSALTPGGWSPPQLVNTTGASDTGADRWPRIAIDAHGVQHVAWASNANIGGAGTDYDIFYTHNLGPGWAAPELVNADGASDAGGSIDDVQPRLAVDRGGVARVVWVGGYNMLDLFTGHPDIFFSKRLPAGWSAAQYVNGAYALTIVGLDIHPDLALDAWGYSHVVWQSNANYNGADGDWDVFYARETDSGWGTVEFVNNNAATDDADDRDPAIETDPDGSVHAIWSTDLDADGAGTDTDIFYARRDGLPWSDPHLLSSRGETDSGADASPELARDALGNLHAVWQTTGAAGTDADLLYVRYTPGTALPSDWFAFANANAYSDKGDDAEPEIAIGRDGLAHFAWESMDTLGGRIGNDLDVLHGWHALDNTTNRAAPLLDKVEDNWDGSARLTWFNYCLAPALSLGFAWDLYAGGWALGGVDGSMWHDLSASPFADSMPLPGSGGYHVWVSNLYDDGSWFPCSNPYTGILFSGTPHTPRNVAASNLGARQVRLTWSPDFYGTWHYQIAAHEATAGWTTLTGPSGSSVWQFVFYASADFMAGRTDLTVPSAGDYTFYIRAASWLPPYTPPTTGAYAMASVTVP